MMEKRKHLLEEANAGISQENNVSRPDSKQMRGYGAVVSRKAEGKESHSIWVGLVVLACKSNSVLLSFYKEPQGGST